MSILYSPITHPRSFSSTTSGCRPSLRTYRPPLAYMSVRGIGGNNQRWTRVRWGLWRSLYPVWKGWSLCSPPRWTVMWLQSVTCLSLCTVQCRSWPLGVTSRVPRNVALKGGETGQLRVRPTLSQTPIPPWSLRNSGKTIGGWAFTHIMGREMYGSCAQEEWIVDEHLNYFIFPASFTSPLGD